MTRFAHWTKRMTNGTGECFWLGKLLIHKYQQDGDFTLSVFDQVNHYLVLHQKIQTRSEWKRAYRLARIALKEEEIDCRSLRN